MLQKKCEDYNILAIDDSQEYLDSLERTFISKEGPGYGYNFIPKIDYKEAIEEIKAKPGFFDLVLIDFQLQDCDGYEVVKQIREFDKDIYLVFLSGAVRTPQDEAFGNNENKVSALQITIEAKVQGFISKTLYPEFFLAMVYSMIRNKEKDDSIRAMRDGFKKVLAYNSQVYNKNSLDELTGIILEQLSDLVRCKDIFILIDENINQGEPLIRGIGKYSNDIENNELISSGKYLSMIGSIRLDNTTTQKLHIVDGNWIIKLLDINDSSKNIGWIWLEFNNAINVNSGEYNSIYQLLEVYTGQIEMAYNSKVLYSKYNNQLACNARQVNKLKRHVNEVINSLRIVVDAKNEYTRGHSDRVAEYSLGTAEKFYGYKKSSFETEGNESNATILERAGWFHDVGKVGISDDVLLKPGRLTKEEYEQMKEHISEGVRILSAIAAFDDILLIVRHHHERLDGSGYPDGLTYKDLADEFMIKLIAITDSYDAMTSGRIYKAADEIMSPKQAIVDLFLKSNIKYKDNKGGVVTGIDEKGKNILEAYWYDREIVINYMRYCESKGYIKVEGPTNDERVPFIIKDTGKIHPDIGVVLRKKLGEIETEIKNNIEEGIEIPKELYNKRDNLVRILSPED